MLRSPKRLWLRSAKAGLLAFLADFEK
jgi:hypothetical protein